MTEITKESMEIAKQYLVDTDEVVAVAVGELRNAEILCKRIRARIFLSSSGNNEERKAAAEVSDEAGKADDHYIAVKVACDTLIAKRESADRDIRIWHSLEASRRQGAFR